MNTVSQQTPIVALDLFAGTGWGVACQRLGIAEHGVEIMPEARASRDAAGMSTIYADVWDGLEDRRSPEAEQGLGRWLNAGGSAAGYRRLLIASPPCQTFSVAGKGSGRKALDDVLKLIPVAADPTADLRAAGSGLDDRTALVLTPLAYAVRFKPDFIALEQVPAVLPVWQAIATVLRGLGYSVETDILNAEQYGVPQTRRRAILVARNDGAQAKLPTPTHSRYYTRDPKHFDEGVLPWVSMAQALGWAGEALVGFPRAADTRGPSVTLEGVEYRERDLRSSLHPSQVITEKTRSWKAWGFTDRPAVTVGNAVGRGLIGGSGAKAAVVAAIADGTFIPSQGDGSNYAAATRITTEEAAVLQAYPREFPFQGTKTKRFLQIGNAVPPLLAERVLKAVTTTAAAADGGAQVIELPTSIAWQEAA